MVNPVDWAANQETLVVNAEDLPLLRQHLELKLKMAEATGAAANVVMRKVQESLADVATVEKILAERTDD
ncbi:hypothetical protein ACFY5D_16910 [Paeniglutamicibacter sp. NPDC012692]|uniref:hypothetical protein n=1 Tax=Paeniglutamicibacter sp. NPDC012692 TaxID=3364388 RepID=UPI0036B270A9